MIYEKRLLVLSGEGNGCLRLERTQSGLVGRLTGDARGECVLAVAAGGKLFTFGSFSLPPAYSFTLPGSVGMDDLVAAVGDMRGKCVMSGGFRRPMPWRANMEDWLARAVRACGGDPNAPARPRVEEKRSIDDYFLDIVPQEYDDGRIAEVNYYRSNLTSESESDEPENEIAAASAEEPVAEPGVSVEPGEREKPDIPPLSDGDYGTRSVPELGRATFYESVADQIDRLFDKCERFEVLEKLLPDSRWVRVDYDASGRYYLVGLIGNPVRYMCYGVPGEYSPEPPPELAGYCQWLALDANDPAGKGFWIMYQDGVTGKSIL